MSAHRTAYLWHGRGTQACDHFCRPAGVCSGHTAGRMPVSALCTRWGMCLRVHTCMPHGLGLLCTHVRAGKRELSRLTLRADRVTFSTGSAISAGAGLSALAGRRCVALPIRDPGVGSSDGWLTDTGAQPALLTAAGSLSCLKREVGGEFLTCVLGAGFALSWCVPRATCRHTHTVHRGHADPGLD